MNQDNIYSVSQLNSGVRLLLEGKFASIWLMGEISNFTRPVSGHWYLTLKDENAQVRCAMWRMKTQRVTFSPQNGMQVLVRASVSLYEPRGDYQLILETMHPAGEGLLQQQFEQLKLKLSAEGLFSQHLKKNLPHFCKRVGIITSPTGAALQDILQILKRRDPSLNVVIYPSAVQGKDAAQEIVQMIELANLRQEVDVLIVGRGGGSLEDLWCFNEEIVAQAIFHSDLPIISAVGHEIDVTIADLVADVRAPTPSAAAELVSRDQQELEQRLNYQRQRLEMAVDYFFQQKKQGLQRLWLQLQHYHPQNRLNLQKVRTTQLSLRLNRAILARLEKTQQKFTALSERLVKNPLPYRLQQDVQQLQQLEVRLEMALKNELKQKHHAFVRLCGKLDGLSPLNVLARGYSITENIKGETLYSVQQVKIGEPLITRLSDGILVSQIEKIQ